MLRSEADHRVSRVKAMTRLQATGHPEDVEVLRRLTNEFGAEHVLSLLAEFAAQEAGYCLLSGDPAKASALARRARTLSEAAEAVAD